MEPKRLSPSKINPTKLLGGSSFSKKTTNIGDKLKEDSISISKSDLSIIKKQVFEIKDLVTSLTTLKKKKLTTERKETEREKFGAREKELEKKKKPEDDKIKLPQAPKLGFLDIVKRFVVNTLIGFVVVRLIKHLPKLIEVAKFVGGAMDFITNVGGKLLNGLATFVQKGYEAYDFTRKTLKSFGGDNALKLFDGFNDALGGIVTAALAASFAIFDMAGGDSGGGDTTGIKGRTPGRSRRGIDPKLARKYAERYGRDAAVSRFGRDGVRSLGGKYARSGVQNLARTGLVSLAGKSGAKAVLKFVKPLVNKIPIIGGLIEFGLSWALGEPVGKAAFRGIGSVLLGGIGTAIGGPIGAFIGAAAGGEVGGALYDLFFGNKKPNQKVAKAAGGGQPVTRGGKLVGGAPRRTAPKSKAKRQISIQPTQLKPGADIGGEEKIEKVFPKSKNKNQVSPLDYIEKSYKNTNQDRFFGSLLNLQTKSLVGQKPSKVDYANAAQGLSNWMTMTFSDEILRTGAVYAAGGGEINADMLSKKSGDMTDAIAKSLEGSISKRLDANIDDLMKQMMLKGIEPEDKDKQDQKELQGTPGEGTSQISGGLSGIDKGVVLAQMLMNDLGITQEAAAGIAGNLYFESSGLTPGEKEGAPYGVSESPWPLGTKRKGYGWAQWTGGRMDNFVKFYGGQNGKIATDQDNYNFLLHEIRNVEPISGIPQDDPIAAANWFRKNWERAGIPHDAQRQRDTMAIYDKLKKEGKVSRVGTGWTKAIASNLQKGDGKFIQGNSGASQGTHFHIGTNKPGDGSGVATAGFGVIKHFLGNKSIYVGRSKETIPTNATDEQIRGYIARGQAAHRQTELDLQIGGTGAGNKVAFPLALSGMKYSSTDGYGVSANVVGTNAFVGHGRYKPDGSLAPQQGMLLSSSSPDFYAFHGMNKFITKDSLLKVHKGEFISVTDKDSVDVLGKDFIATINSIENSTQLKQRVGSLINHLSYITGYEPGGSQEVIVEMQEPEIISTPMPVPVGGGGIVMMGSGSGEDYSQELYSHS